MNVIRYLSVFVVLMFLTPSLSVEARKITGRVLASSDSVPVAGAVCKVESGGKVIASSNSDANGIFEIDMSINTVLNLAVSKKGFLTTKILIDAGRKHTGLGDIYLNEEFTELQEFTVHSATTSDVAGRTVVFPGASDVRASATALSLFQKLSLDGLDVNPINRTLSVDRGTPMILINGVPSTTDDLNALNPKDILKVEYSRMTPIRYADKGVSGLLNITLKKRNDGGQVYMWMRSAVNTTFMDANVRLAYHQGPSQISLYYRPSWRNYHDVHDIVSQAFVAPDFRVDLKEEDRDPFNYSFHNMQLKYDYTPNSATLFSATFMARPMRNSTRFIGKSEDSEAGSYDFDKSNRSHDFTPSLDLFLRRDFNEKNSLEIQVVGSLSDNNYRMNNSYLYPDGMEDVYEMNVDSRRRSLISEVSYIHKFSGRTSLATGFQNTVSHSTNSYLDSDFKPVLTENNNYAYVRLGQQVGKVYFSAGTGVKMFWTHNDDIRRHFVRNLSNANISWNPNSHWTFRCTFNYSPNIPSLSALTDYEQQISPYLITNGNPNLKASQYFGYGLYATWRAGKLTASYNAYLNNTTNCMVNDVVYKGDRLFLRQMVNSRLFRMLDNYVSLKLSDISGFGANANFNLTHFTTEGDVWKHNLTSFSASFSVYWSKGPFVINYWYKIPGKNLNGHYVSKNENGNMLSVDYRPDKHWVLSAQWMYMFDKKGTRYPWENLSVVNPGVGDRFIRNNSNMIVFSVQYNADFGSIFRTGKRSLNNSDDGSSLLTR